MMVLSHVLRIYGHHRLMPQMVLPAAGCLVIAAHIALAVSYPKTSWSLFLCAIAFISVASGYCMGQALKEGEETDLVPAYRGYQMAAAFALPAILISWVLALTVLSHGPILLTVSSFLSMAVLSLWYGLYCLNGLLFRDNSRVVRFMSYDTRSFLIIYCLFLNALGNIGQHAKSIMGIYSFFILLAFVTCIAVMTSWFGAYFLNNLSALAGGAFILWVIYGICGISEFADTSRWSAGIQFRSLENFRLNIFLTIVLFLSLCAAILICWRYLRYVYISEWEIYTYSADPYWGYYSFISYDGLKLPYMFSPESWHRDYVVCLWNRDKTQPGGVKKAELWIMQLSSKLRAGVVSSRLGPLLRFGILSPVFVAGSDWLKFAAFCYVGTCMAFAYCLAENSTNAINFILPGLLFFSAAILANDFQAHRNRLPLLYFQTALPSRAAFLKQSLRAYEWSVLLMSLRIVATAFVSHLFILWFSKNILQAKSCSFELIDAASRFHWSWDGLVQMIVMGLGLALGQVAASLLTGKRRAYAGGPAWLAGNALLLVPITVIAYRFHSWPLNIALVLVSAALFLHARHRWLDIELDFA